jgi:hypothetical protein
MLTLKKQIHIVLISAVQWAAFLFQWIAGVFVLDERYNFLPKYVATLRTLKDFKAKIKLIAFPEGITAEVELVDSYAFAKIYFEDTETYFYIDGDGDYFIGNNGTYVLTTYRIICAYYERWKKQKKLHLNILLAS